MYRTHTKRQIFISYLSESCIFNHRLEFLLERKQNWLIIHIHPNKMKALKICIILYLIWELSDALH